MTTEWAVVAGGDQFTLDAQNAGELTFTVSNPGPVADTVVFDVLPGPDTQRSWFMVKDPQRLIKPNGAASFRVKVAVPAGTPARRYDVAGLAYSASAPPEESSRTSGRVSFDVGVSVAVKKKPWPILVAAAVLVLVVIGVAAFVLWPSGDDDKAAGSGPQAGSASATASTAPTIPDLHGTYFGTSYNERTKESGPMTLILTQSDSRLTAVLTDRKPDAIRVVGSGTAAANRTITMRFEVIGVVNFEGTEVSPGRLTGKWAYEDKSDWGTFDVCTCG